MRQAGCPELHAGDTKPVAAGRRRIVLGRWSLLHNAALLTERVGSVDYSGWAGSRLGTIAYGTYLAHMYVLNTTFRLVWQHSWDQGVPVNSVAM
jgi:peptidoglycan/LPS O-acetylase OafA/YrhL